MSYGPPHPRPGFPHPPKGAVLTGRGRRRPNWSVIQAIEHRQGMNSPDPALDHHAERGGQLLLRKEVIQPHLPVRLPCYDFVPIADPTFDGSLPHGLGHRLRVLPTFVT